MMDTKILVIDDDVNICDMIKLYLENSGYEVKTANDGVEGVSFFKSYDPDIVLLDDQSQRYLVSFSYNHHYGNQ